MRPPNPQLTSLTNRADPTSSAYASWLDHCQSTNEYFELLAFLCSVPEIWITSAEKKVAGARRRGVAIKNLLGYRLTTLWSGIVHLQEAKFICDAVESAFRQRVLLQSRLANATPFTLCIPSWSEIEKRHIEAFGRPPHATKLLDTNVLSVLTFGQLLQLMKRNWFSLPPDTRWKTGIRDIFAVNAHRCRSLSAFSSDMKMVKAYRDAIAHSRDLLDRHQVQRLYAVSCRWLTPLGVSLSAHIRMYRARRPRFLREVELE